MSTDPVVSHKADAAFSQARRRAFFRQIVGFITGHQPGNLLSLDEVRDKLEIHGQHYAGIQTIAIDRIVGSAGRYHEFNRAFLPTQEFLRERWKQIYLIAHEPKGFPPIDVYQVGEIYFVRDGHHRVSVLRELGATSVEATVTVLDTPVPLSQDLAQEDLDLKAEYAAFLRATGLERERPDSSVEFSLPGQYRKLHEHIAVHRHYLGLREQREIPEAEAVVRWYDEVYLPVVQAIREAKILAGFPGRTEVDLYMWLIEHKHYLSERYSQDVSLDQAVADFSTEFSGGPARRQLESETQPARGQARRSKRIQPVVAVFGSGSVPGDHPVLAQAERLGQLLAEAGYTLMSGGYGGTMEALSRGARHSGVEAPRIIGVTMDLFTPPLQPNPFLTEEKRVRDFFPRLERLVSADAFVVLRGGIGTLTEATLVWSLLQTGQIPPRPFVYIGEHWRRLFEALQAETFITERDLALVRIADDVDQAVQILKDMLEPIP